MFDKSELEAIAQVDVLERIHHYQPLDALSKMSFAILQAVIHKLERRYGRAILEDVNKSMQLIRYEAGGYFLDVEEIVERPPMWSIWPASGKEVRRRACDSSGYNNPRSAATAIAAARESTPSLS